MMLLNDLALFNFYLTLIDLLIFTMERRLCRSNELGAKV